MTDTIKSLYAGVAPPANTVVYTVPEGKYAVVKSIVLCNPNSIETNFTVLIAGMHVAYGHILKPNSTLAIDNLDVPMLTGTQIIVFSASNSPLTAYISGFERDYVQSEYSYTLATGNSTTGIYTGEDRLIKSIVIVGGIGSTDGKFTIQVAGQTIINSYTIKPRDTLILPSTNVFHPKERNLNINISSAASTVYFGVIWERLLS
ncbi:hypothetical protein J2W91_002441 [Paenibacillus amylolyticus]|uniref:Uncharacterized protein n=1 Tax=Paenibacillus amylolyticus TaxID=1451 RepID=A0AAP5LR02_PAEAM|nr:hypothetical protein [Paenibacillus amylolyticus]MDR6723979.1 hypothetical protein [Paenibacillus amylolyticus]